MKLGYLRMIQKPSDNQCSGSQHQLQDQKKARMSHSKFKDMLIVFFDIVVLWYCIWYCDGRVGTQRPDGESAVLHWSLDEIAWTCEQETAGIMEKRVDFATGQRASPQRIVCEAIFS